MIVRSFAAPSSPPPRPKVSAIIHKRVSFVLCTADAVKHKTQKVRKALRHGIPLVSQVRLVATLPVMAGRAWRRKQILPVVGLYWSSLDFRPTVLQKYSTGGRVGLIGHSWPFGRPRFFFFLLGKQRLQNTLRNRKSAAADLEPPKGLGLRVGLGPGLSWSGPMCRIERSHKRPAGSLLHARFAFRGSPLKRRGEDWFLCWPCSRGFSVRRSPCFLSYFIEFPGCPVSKFWNQFWCQILDLSDRVAIKETRVIVLSVLAFMGA